MPGIKDLKQALKSIKVSCDDVKYGFVSIADKSQITLDKVLATFYENGRLSIIAPQEYLEDRGLRYEGPYAKLTIDVPTFLELVGLTAVITNKLAEHGIAANVVAAFYHDHISVPYQLRQKATKLLEGLSED